MSWWLANFKGKRNTAGFKQNPQNIVPWRPRRGVRLLNEKIKEKVWKILSKNEIEDMIIWMLDLTKDELKEIANDKNESSMSVIVAQELTKKDWGLFWLNTLLDRWIWKPKQATEVIQKTELTISKEDQDQVDKLISLNN